MEKDKRLAWLDLETTGFTELHKRAVYAHKVIEIGTIVTDCDFNIIAQQNLVIHQDMGEVLSLSDDVVLSMHNKNGLFKDVQASTLSLRDAEQQVIQFLVDHGVERKMSPLCGNGITFDRIYLEAQLPLLNDHLHYRNLDISAVKEFIKLLNPDFEPKKKLGHRALDDIRESVAEAASYRALLQPLLQKSLRQDSCPSPV